MTVRELIAALSVLDGDLPVCREDSEYDPLEITKAAVEEWTEHLSYSSIALTGKTSMTVRGVVVG